MSQCFVLPYPLSDVFHVGAGSISGPLRYLQRLSVGGGLFVEIALDCLEGKT